MYMCGCVYVCIYNYHSAAVIVDAARTVIENNRVCMHVCMHVCVYM